MKIIIKTLITLLVLSFSNVVVQAGDWTSMFDGKTLKGWKVNTENPKTISVVKMKDSGKQNWINLEAVML